jgi:hypothetical protein
MTKTCWEAPMGGSVLSFLKAEWKVSDTGSAHWASSCVCFFIVRGCGQTGILYVQYVFNADDN